MTGRPMHCGIIPPYLLERLQGLDDDTVARCARETLEWDHVYRTARATRSDLPPESVAPATTTPEPITEPAPRRTVSDAAGSTTLPGRTVREEGGPASNDAAVDEAYDGLGATWELYWSAYGRNSLDANGLPLLASVHYGSGYDN